MPFVLAVLAMIAVGIILSMIDRHSPRGKQLLFYFYLIIALLSLMRGIMFSAALFGIFALWQWMALQRLKAGYRSFTDFASRKTAGTKAGRANLPKGCPPDCTELDVTGLNLQAINLSGADLRGANLFVADLRQANLGGANLEGVDLGGAKLHGADLRRANLDGADLRGAKYNEDTIWPTNFNPGQAGAVRGD
jgi:uncharacterized protein YjbI with pentapeptide repeats